jgi:hypothetical protein
MLTRLYFPFLPPTLNEIISAAKSNNGREYSRLKHDYTRDCAIVAMGSPVFAGEVWLAFDWQIKTLRRDPADNTPAAAKFVLDGLVQAGVLRDDSGFVIQPPVVHRWGLASQEGLILTISDRPIYQLRMLCENQSIA